MGIRTPREKEGSAGSATKTESRQIQERIYGRNLCDPLSANKAGEGEGGFNDERKQPQAEWGQTLGGGVVSLTSHRDLRAIKKEQQ